MLHLVLSILLALHFDAPAPFVSEAPTSHMQSARWRIPAGEPDKDGKPAAASDQDVQVVVYYFGNGQGGSVQANIDRWLGQFPEKDGDPKTEHLQTKSGMPLTILDVSGTEKAGTPMDPNPASKPGRRLIGAIIETSEGSYFVKATGPKAQVEKHEKEIRAMLESAAIAK
jgi:hypothetical protein